MKYRTKLLLLFVGLALVTSLAVTTLFYIKTRQYLYEQIQSKVLSIATGAALMIDAEAHERIRNDADANGKDYAAIVDTMRKVRDANRREDVYVKYIYTMRPAKGAERVWRFVVDAEESVADRAMLNDIYRPLSGIEDYSLVSPQVQSHFTTDQWGTWLTATAPLLLKDGTPVAIVGVDISASRVIKELRIILYLSLAAMALSIALAVAIATWLSKKVTKPLLAIRSACDEIAAGNLHTEVTLKSEDEFGEVAQSINNMIFGLQQRDNLVGALARFTSAEVTDALRPGATTQGRNRHEKRKITVLFADIQGFSNLTNSLSAEEIAEILGSYYDRMIDTVLQNHGFLNKFMGDGLMAVFGGVKDDPYQEENAIRTALEMRKSLSELTAKWKQEGKDERAQGLTLAMGISTGVALVGDLGSRHKIGFDCIGDTVTMAARLQHACAEKANVDVLISEFTTVAVAEAFKFKECGAMALKGRADLVRLYTL